MDLGHRWKTHTYPYTGTADCLELWVESLESCFGHGTIAQDITTQRKQWKRTLMMQPFHTNLKLTNVSRVTWGKPVHEASQTGHWLSRLTGGSAPFKARLDLFSFDNPDHCSSPNITLASPFIWLPLQRNGGQRAALHTCLDKRRHPGLKSLTCKEIMLWAENS